MVTLERRRYTTMTEIATLPPGGRFPFRETEGVVGVDPQGTVAHKAHDPERPETVKGAPLIVIDPLEVITREVDPVRDRCPYDSKARMCMAED